MNGREILFMRVYGRLVKNIAGVLLLLALCSLLLPFCKFNVGAGDTTLSGIEVAKAGGKAGYTYFKTGGIPDDFILKAPYTWGNVKAGVSYVSSIGGTNVLILCGVAILVPIVLCFLAMCMLFIAEGKKSMFLPTLFTLAVAVEMLFIILFITDLQPFLMVGVYLFTILNVAAFLFILIGWITGGYRKPERDYGKRTRYKKKEENPNNENGDKNGQEQNSSHKRTKTRRKRKKDKRKDRKKRDRNKRDSRDRKEKKQEPENRSSQSITGRIRNGTGIYHGLSWNIKNGSSHVITVGTTPEAMEALRTKSVKNMECIVNNNCKISYDVASDKYSIESHSKDNILLVKDGKVVRCLGNGDRVKVSCEIILQLSGRGDSITLG